MKPSRTARPGGAIRYNDCAPGRRRVPAMHRRQIVLVLLTLSLGLLGSVLTASAQPATARADLKPIPPGAKPAGRDLKPFEYVEAKIPFYAPGRNRTGKPGADGWNKMQLPLDPLES